MGDSLQVVEISRNAAQTFFEDEWPLFNEELFGGRFLWTTQGEFHLGAGDGQGALMGAARFTIAEGVGYLRELVVRSDCRGRGVGSSLLDRFEQSCLRRGCHKLFLDVAEVNVRAQAFYRTHGWEQEGVMKRHWRETNFQTWIKWIG